MIPAMFFKTCISLVSFFTCIFAQGGPVTEKYPQHATLDTNYLLYWKTNATTIVFEVHAKSQGWAGLGFSKDGHMFPGDVAIGYVSADGNGHLNDYHTVGYRLPVRDAQQDCQLLASSLDHNGIMLKFSRALDTGDHNDWTLTTGDIHVIWAFGDMDPASVNPLYHKKRGTMVLQLVSGGVPVGK